MKKITFEIKSILKLKLDMVEFPELNSKRKWVQKGIDVLKQHAPGILAYLSKESIMGRLKEYEIILKTERSTKEERLEFFFNIWLKKEKAKRLLFVFIEVLLIPFTGILALLPGPNFFFYVPALLLYYHFTTYRGLRHIDVDELNIEVIHY
ncbi:MAG: hypothetical protein KAW12_15015 [Candidatus Aminicenantes bacterium]|nr:hypothetical protein [Candidatus Aminicenantes bacterium]